MSLKNPILSAQVMPAAVRSFFIRPICSLTIFPSSLAPLVLEYQWQAQLQRVIDLPWPK